VNDFESLPDLASERLGGRVMAANDEFFAPKENLLKPSQPIFIEGKYTDRGKWMDGWETRRRRTPGFDWCIVRLGLPGLVRGVIVYTRFFRGNFPEQCCIEAATIPAVGNAARERAALLSPKAEWKEILGVSQLQGDTKNAFTISCQRPVTHLRLKIFPDGGVARLRVHGRVAPRLPKPGAKPREADLAAIVNGGRILGSSDGFFGEPLNLLMPGRAVNMGDGWETRRRRGPGHDWVILKLGATGTIRRVEVDTSHFKGNFPDRCSLEACLADDGEKADQDLPASVIWKLLLSQAKLRANARHVFRRELLEVGDVSHVRFNIFPDGGVARLRVWGIPALSPSPRGVAGLNAMPEKAAAAALGDCCGSRAWVRRMLARRPFADTPALLRHADEAWSGLGRAEVLEAFRHHPRIGGTRAKGQQSPKARNWSAKEQSSAVSSSPQYQAALAAANRTYERKFGHIFIVCATGLTGEEILARLNARLSNDAETELRVAAEEQRKITRIRLEKLIAS